MNAKVDHMFSKIILDEMVMKQILLSIIFFSLLPLSQPVAVDTEEHPLAPPLDVSEWINGDGVTLDELRGKVVIIDFFQMWCPGCNAFSIPLVAQWEDIFADKIASGDLVVLSIHTVFEGHLFQTPAKLKRYLKKKDIKHLVGIDRHSGHDVTPETMKNFQTRGTPEIAFIDRQGHIRFQIFGGFNADAATHFLQLLLNEKIN